MTPQALGTKHVATDRQKDCVQPLILWIDRKRLQTTAPGGTLQPVLVTVALQITIDKQRSYTAKVRTEVKVGDAWEQKGAKVKFANFTYTLV